MKQKHGAFFACALAFGLLAGAALCPKTSVYADTTSPAASICGDLGAVGAISDAGTLEIGDTGTMRFSAYAYENVSANGNVTYTYKGTLAGAYRITVPEGNNYHRIYVQNMFGSSMTVTIYDVTRNAVSTFRVGIGESNSWTGKLTASGTYYIVASCSNKNISSGQAYVRVDTISDNAGDNNWTSASASLDSAVTGQLELSSDVDYFKIHTSKKKAYYRFTGWNISGKTVKFSVVDDDQKNVTSFSVSANSSAQKDLVLEADQDYFVIVSGSAESKYKFKLSCLKDDVKDDADSAKTVKVGEKAVSYAIQTASDTDTFKFSSGKYTTLEVKVKNKSSENAISVYVANEDGKVLSRTTASASGSAVLDLTNLEKKSRYYIYVEGKTGDAKYSVSVNSIKKSITYEKNGGKLAKGSIKKYEVSVKTKLPTPTKKGYTFMGWYTSADFRGDAVTSIAATETKDITLYAKWEKTAAKK